MPSDHLTKYNLFSETSPSPATHWVWLSPGSAVSSRMPACRRSRTRPAPLEKDRKDAVHPRAGRGSTRKATHGEVEKHAKIWFLSHFYILVWLLLTLPHITRASSDLLINQHMGAARTKGISESSTRCWLGTRQAAPCAEQDTRDAAASSGCHHQLKENFSPSSNARLAWRDCICVTLREDALPAPVFYSLARSSNSQCRRRKDLTPVGRLWAEGHI